MRCRINQAVLRRARNYAHSQAIQRVSDED